MVQEISLTLKRDMSVSYPDFRDWQRNARAFQQMAVLRWQDYNLTSPGTPEHLNGKGISWGFFSTLGVKLTLGRDFAREEDQSGGAPAVIVSNRLWRNRFAGSAEALGRSITLDGSNYTVVGVLPSAFRKRGGCLHTARTGRSADYRRSHNPSGDRLHRPPEARRDRGSGAGGHGCGSGSAESDLSRGRSRFGSRCRAAQAGDGRRRKSNSPDAVGRRGTGLADRLRKRSQSAANALGGALWDWWRQNWEPGPRWPHWRETCHAARTSG